MKKLKDLKENECISCSGKEIKKIVKLIQKDLGISLDYFQGIYKLKGNIYIHPINKCWTYDLDKDEVAFSANHFIKPKAKTSKRLKQLEKKVDYLSDFVANMQPKTKSIHQQLSREEAAKHPDCFAKVNESGTGLVFEPDGNPETKELEVGKWYKQGKSFAGVEQYLIYVVKKDDLGVEGYGICDGVWFNNANSYCLELIEASKEEVESALIAEAERRGFKGGVEVNNSELSDSCCPDMTLNGVIGFSEFWEYNYIWFGRQLIYDKGKWAEIIKQPKDIDWSVPQLVIINKHNIVQTTGVHSHECFEGMVVKQSSRQGFKKFKFSNEWMKNVCKPFEGEITLKND